MKRNVAIGVGLAVVVVGLVALNLSMRPDPEPEYVPSGDPLPERRYSDVLRDGLDEEPPPEAVDEVADPEAGPAATEEAVDGCDHPYIPSRTGQWRLYRWAITTEDYVAEVRIRAHRTRVLPDGERVVTWLVRASREGETERPSQVTLDTRCRPGEDAEDPWFGILERAIGHRFTRRTQRWRWPAVLGPGVSFRGTATLDPSAADAQPPEGVEGEHMLTVTRHHIVDEAVDVEVPAGTFHAWRIAYEERQAYGSHGETGTGTMWVAEDVGMVKTRAENSRGVVQTIELMQMH
ncbi:MAG: hypothetical protein KC619_23840 [Myxococcales bacterium]|nr:hypothetical protein [Myxococcales bacterium]